MFKVGIDIGGTNLRCAIFDEGMNKVEYFKCPNNKSKKAEENLKEMIDFIKSFNGKIESIGIGAPGPLDAHKGLILNPPNLVGWDNFNIVEYFINETGISTKLSNDANVAALGEAILGAGKGFESVYYITMSTGFGGGYVFRNELINGVSTCAGEIYNMIVNEDHHCHKGTNAGSLNEQCGGYGLSVIAEEIFGYPMSAEALFKLWHDGNETAIQLIEKTADIAAKGIANVGCVIDPEVYVVGGSIANYNPDFVEMVFEKAKKYYIKPEYLQYRLAHFLDDAGLIGAALL
ncbi:MAG: ROK family protein [Bacilli bacterium]|nr:ROK family protein [Bacilli bacterium]